MIVPSVSLCTVCSPHVPKPSVSISLSMPSMILGVHESFPHLGIHHHILGFKSMVKILLQRLETLIHHSEWSFFFLSQFNNCCATATVFRSLLVCSGGCNKIEKNSRHFISTLQSSHDVLTLFCLLSRSMTNVSPDVDQ